MTQQMNITGSGGGKGKGGGKDAANTLRSNARARFIELISEGELESVAVNGDKSIYFDGTPLRNENDTLNFQGVTFETREGTPDQAHLNGIPYIETPFTVNSQVQISTGPVVRTINEANADAVRVIVRLPALVFSDSKGQLVGTDLSYKIEVKPFGGAWVTTETVVIVKQKSTSAFQRAHRVELPLDGHPWDIRVVRLTADSEDEKLQNDLFFDSYTVLVEGRYTFPNSAIVAMEIDAEQFGSSAPQRAYHVKGLKIQVPSNYNAETREYTGIWNGTFDIAYTNNPAWVIYDLITNDRYGLGQFIEPAAIDKWSLYAIAQYCDVLVPSGFKDEEGEDILEPRFTFNGVLNTRKEAFKVLQDIATAFRGMGFWAEGQVFFSADMPSDPVTLLTPANVIGGRFNYSGTSLKARSSVAMVSWNDPGDLYRSAVEVVINEEQLKKFGWREKNIQLTGCTSRGLAHRFGKWVLDVEEHETETIDYEAAWDQANVRPGHIIAVADPAKAGIRTGGRIIDIDVTKTLVTLDAPFSVGLGETYSLMLHMPDGTVETSEIVEFTVGNTIVEVDTAFSATPVPGAVYIVTGTDVQPRQYRVLTIDETETNRFRVTALLHDPDKYDRIEQGMIIEPRLYARPSRFSSPVQNLTASEERYIDAGIPRSRILVSWSPPQDLLSKQYQISAETPNGNIDYGRTTNTILEVEPVIAGDYTFYVSSVSYAGLVAPPEEFTLAVESWAGTSNPYVENLAVNIGAALEFEGPTASIRWENKFPDAEAPLTGNVFSPFYRDNVIEVYRPASIGPNVADELLRSVSVRSNVFDYTIDMNQLDNAVLGYTPSRAVKFIVKVRDTLDRTSINETITITNPVPVGIVPTLTSSNNAVHVKYTRPTDPDFAGVQIWMSATNGFTPGSGNLVYDGPNTVVSIPAVPETFYYVRIAPYDEFGKVGINVSAQYTIQAQGITVDVQAIIDEVSAGVDVIVPNDEWQRLASIVEGNLNGLTEYYDNGLKIEGIQAESGDNKARIIAIDETIASPDFVSASILRAVDATGQTGSATAGFRLQAVSAPVGVTARYEVQLATNSLGDDFTTAGFFIDILPDTTRRVVFNADQFYFTDGTTAPFYVVGGNTYIDGLFIRNKIRSIDTKLEFDAEQNRIVVYD